MDEPQTLISSPAGVLATLCLVAAGFFLLAERSRLRFFDYVPPLIFIYATPVLLNNFGVIPAKSPVYGGLSSYVLPAFIVMMLIKVNVPAVVRVMGKGVLVMLMGTAGVVVGAVVAYLAVNRWLPDDAWRGYGALAGSWIGGTANLLATSEILETPEEQVGLAVLADNLVYVVWLPILLMSRNYAEQFNRWAKVPAERVADMEAAAELHIEADRAPAMTEYLYLAAVVATVTWMGHALAPGISTAIAEHTPFADVFGETTVRILLVTTVALILSTTPVSTLPNTTALGTMLVYVFVAGMGARASIAGLASAPAFVAGAFIWIAIHGAFCLAGARLFRVDVHSVAIASAANIGAAASAPIVAAHHRPSLVPVSILMALLGYALGNYLAPLAGNLARIAAGQ